MGKDGKFHKGNWFFEVYAVVFGLSVLMCAAQVSTGILSMMLKLWCCCTSFGPTVTNPPRLVILFVVPWVTNFGRTEEKAKLPWMWLLLLLFQSFCLCANVASSHSHFPISQEEDDVELLYEDVDDEDEDDKARCKEAWEGVTLEPLPWQGRFGRFVRRWEWDEAEERGARFWSEEMKDCNKLRW